MRLSYTLQYDDGRAREAVEQVAVFEKAGIDVVWVAEPYGFDAPSLMGYIAAKTERIEIGSGIVPIYTRTPTLTAMTAAGIDSLSGGRCILGIGASGPQVIEGFHGVPYDHPLGRTREVIEICRNVWRREAVRYEGRHYCIPIPPEQGTGLGKPLKLITRPVRDRIPIFVAALGPRNVQMTAEIADGWLPIMFIPERADAVWGGALASGTASRSAELGPMEVVASCLVSIGDDAASARDLARPQVALYVGGMGARGRNFYNDVARRYGFEKEAEEVQNLYLDGKKEDAAAAVPEAFLEGTSLCGPAGYVRDRLAAFKEKGVTILNITPVGPDPVRIIEQIKEWVE